MAPTPSIHLSSVTFGHLAGTPVLSDVDLDLGPGWHGVVGANGAGKTTLLRLVTGDVQPTRGRIDVVSAAAPMWCRQAPRSVPADVADFARQWDGTAARWRRRLGLDPDDIERWATLSPGERARWQVATALAAGADVLLLDEPTDHLDDEGRALLVDALARFDGLGLVVSHDRSLLNALTTTTLRVHAGAVERWSGPYEAARPQWELQRHQVEQAHAAARREERRLAAELDVRRRARSGADRGVAAARRRADPRDHDATEAGRKFAQAKAEAAHARAVAATRGRLERHRAAMAAVPRQRGGPVSVQAEPSAADRLVALRRPVIEISGRVVLRDVDVHVTPADRIHLAGPNGAGKTTLLRAIESVVPATVAFRFLPQELSEADVAELWRWLHTLPRDDRGRVLAIAANLGANPADLLLTQHPSPGQARKVALARLLDRPTALLLLDEPTNHLDLPAVERLEQALATTTAALVCVSHDGKFARRVTTARWDVGGGSVVARVDVPVNPEVLREGRGTSLSP